MHSAPCISLTVKPEKGQREENHNLKLHKKWGKSFTYKREEMTVTKSSIVMY